jgi:putative sterol carrier protein
MEHAHTTHLAAAAANQANVAGHGASLPPPPTRGDAAVSIQFLTPEWASAVQGALNAHPGFKGAIANADLALQFNVANSPVGDLSYYMKAAGGSAELSLGTVEPADVTVGQSYDTACAIAKGELNTQTAFMTGKLKVSGNLAKLMMHQAAIAQWQAATKDIEISY